MENKAKHTPGPWTIPNPNPGDIGAFIEAENPSFKSPGKTPLESKTRIVAKVPFGAIGGRHGADARLIAACPDMLAALENAEASIELVRCLDAGQAIDTEADNMLDSLQNRIRAAIAKAKGE